MDQIVLCIIVIQEVRPNLYPKHVACKFYPLLVISTKKIKTSLLKNDQDDAKDDAPVEAASRGVVIE